MSVINLDEVGTLCLPSCLSLSPNLVVNDPFPLFSQPIFYPLDHVQYGCFFMQMSGGWSGGATANNQKLIACRRVQWKNCDCNRNWGTKERDVHWYTFPTLLLFSQVAQM